MAADLVRLRLSNQRLARASDGNPEDVVAWFGAVQAQDYLGALWGIGQRLARATEAVVEAAEARRAIVRTWPMRGTLHFVAAADARWITQLLAPRILARHSARWRRDFGIDARLVARADDILTRELSGGKRLARERLYAALETRRIRTAGSRGLHLLLCLAMRGRLCLAGRIGKQHSFALLDEWIPDARSLDREAALATLATRYFSSHGPATSRDFAWWAGITTADANVAIDGAQRQLLSESFEGERHWFGASPHPRIARTAPPRVRLLPGYDEYTVGYADRAALLETGSRLAARGMGLLSPVVVIDGLVVGTWKRSLDRQGVTIDTQLARELARDERDALQTAVAGYGRFLGLEGRWHG
jgi:hypothetical protein